MLHACGLLIYCINERVDSEGMPLVRLAFLKDCGMGWNLP